MELLGCTGGYLADSHLTDNLGPQDPWSSSVVWEAPSAGDCYITVQSYLAVSTGSYSLTVSLSDTVDDHPGYIEAAHAIPVGSPVPGAIDYVGDVDIFLFTAEEGRTYQLDVEVGTLGASILNLYDSSGGFLASDRALYERALSIVWEAPSTGNYHAVVGGQGYSDSYTLTISPLI
ncbi:MAG: hypothetical protein F4045_06815 [Chloroflexi bacterium]|nr:hypothetical protein [Chloroflexota bacterium]MYK34812.1 hypothetical protein [Chloroflexota bacterium]